MLKLVLSEDWWDEVLEKFVPVVRGEIELEHSLVSLSKWEEIWEKPYLSNTDKSSDEMVSYIQCMILTPEFDPDLLKYVTEKQIESLNNYINRPMSATTFAPHKKDRNREVITAEIFYHWMIALNIPFECQNWHLNKLLSLIRVCSEKNSPKKKRVSREDLAMQSRLNEERQKKYNTTG